MDKTAVERTGNSREVRSLLAQPHIRVFLPSGGREAGVFRTDSKPARLLHRIDAALLDTLVADGRLRELKKGGKGRHFVPAAPRARAADRRNAKWLAAERAFSSPEGGTRTIQATMGESPIGWLARHRDAAGNPFLSDAETAAGERLRADFERAQLAPAVAQDWRRFLTSGVTGGVRISAQERNVCDGAEAARKRVADALDVLGPGLADVALRVCCFLEGLERIESSMNWSARSGKIVLKIALQRLAAYYDESAMRRSASIEAWRSTGS